MFSEARDKNGNLAAYRLTGKDRLKFEVAMTEFNGRLVNMESHIQNFKYTLEKIMNDQKTASEKQQEIINFVKEWMANVGTDVKNISCEGGILDRIDTAEKSILKISTGIRILTIGSPIALAIIGLAIKFWHP